MRRLTAKLVAPKPLCPETPAEILARPELDRLRPFAYLQTRRQRTSLSDDVDRALRRAYNTSLRRNLFLHRELVDLVERLSRHSIDVIPLKGTDLALRLYDDIARPTQDIDLLVRKDQLRQAARILADAGYSESEDVGRYDILFLRRDSARTYGVELHRSFDHFASCAERFVDACWERSQSIEDGELRGARRLEPTDELTYLCLNLCRHRFRDPFLALDVHLAIRRWQREVDWNELVQRCSRHRLRYPVGMALEFARHWFGTEVPDDTIYSLKPPLATRKLLRWIEWTGNTHELEAIFPITKHFEIALRMMLLDETWGDRAEHLSFASRTARRLAQSRWRAADRLERALG